MSKTPEIPPHDHFDANTVIGPSPAENMRRIGENADAYAQEFIETLDRRAKAEATFDEKFGRDLRESGTALMNRRFYGSFTPMRDRDASLQHVASEFAEQIVAKLNTMPGEARAKWIADLFVEMGKLRD